MINNTNKTVFANNLRFYMDEAKKTRTDICEDLGFKYSTFNDWYNGIKYPRIDKIEMLANYFNIGKSKLIENHDNPTISEFIQDDIYMVPIYDSVTGAFQEDNKKHICYNAPLPTKEPELAKRCIGVLVRGDSMSPLMDDHDVIEVLKDEPVKDGEYGAVSVDGKDFYIRKIDCKNEDEIKLISVNLYYPPLVFKGTEKSRVKILGKVAKVIKVL